MIVYASCPDYVNTHVFSDQTDRQVPEDELVDQVASEQYELLSRYKMQFMRCIDTFSKGNWNLTEQGVLIYVPEDAAYVRISYDNFVLLEKEYMAYQAPALKKTLEIDSISEYDRAQALKQEREIAVQYACALVRLHGVPVLPHWHTPRYDRVV